MSISIQQITLAVTNMNEMVAFYNAVLDTNLTSFEPFSGTTFYKGTLAGIPLLICPNEVAQVDANQNRQQFRFEVDNIQNRYISALDAGGKQISAIEEEGDQLICAVYDPDGNSIVFAQQQND